MWIKYRALKVHSADLLIILLIAGVNFANYFWLMLDSYPPVGHGLSGILPAVLAYREFKGLPNSYAMYDHLWGMYIPANPPLSFLVVLVFLLLFGPVGQMVVMVNALYVTVALLCVYAIGRRIGGPWIGLLSAFVLSSFPGFIAFSRVYVVEFGLLAYVALSLYLLLKTEFFEKRIYATLLGVCLALSFLHKYQSLLFIIGPFLLIVYKSGVHRSLLRRKWSPRATNILLAIGLGILLSSFWWWKYGRLLLTRIDTVTATIECSELKKFSYLSNATSLQSLFFYWGQLKVCTGMIFYLFFAIYPVCLFRKTAEAKLKFSFFYFLSSLIFAIAILTFILTKNLHHVLSAMVPFALLCGIGVSCIKTRALKIILAGGIFLSGLFNLSQSFLSLRIPDSFTKFSAIRFIIGKTKIFETALQPRQKQWEQAILNVLEYLRMDWQEKQESNAFFINVDFQIGGAAFEYYSLLGNYPIRFYHTNIPDIELSQFMYVVIEKADTESMEDVCKRAYISPFIRQKVKAMLSDEIMNFELIKTIPFPNHDKLFYIYKRKKSF